VVFGVQALTPEVPVNAKMAFVSQMLTLPGVVCDACTAQDSWTRHWSASPLTLDRRHTQAEQGWYVFSSGLEGIAVGIQAAPDSRQTAEGKGARSEDSRDITVGLVRTGRHREIRAGRHCAGIGRFSGRDLHQHYGQPELPPS
jgi:hypothetical protein